jgi:SNF2 family DNA or RNA helicase
MDEVKRDLKNSGHQRFKTKPYSHQLDYLQYWSEKEAVGITAEMGTGKTWMIINDMASKWGNSECDAVLVLAPNGVHRAWHHIEIPTHMPTWVHYKSVEWLTTSKKEYKKDLESIFNVYEPRPLRILTMNWEAIQSKRGFDFAEKFCSSFTKVMIVCDESDAIKNPKAARTKALFKLKPYSKFRRIMTGTMINNTPFDAFTQLSFLDDHILGTSSFYSFKAEYAEMLEDNDPLLKNIRSKMANGGRFSGAPQIVAKDQNGAPIYKNLEKLNSIIKKHCYRVTKKDCLDLPEKIYKTVFFDLTAQQKDIYRQAKEECRIVFKSEATTFNKLVAFGKLSQITSGYYSHPLSEEPVRIQGATPKIDLLVDHVLKIVDSGEKVIVWAKYRVEIQDIFIKLREKNISVVQYHGDTTTEARKNAIKNFEKGDTQVFLGNPQAAGIGITLVAASYVIYFSNSFSLRNRLQSEDRAHRIGQTKNVTYINLAAKDTIDEDIISSLLNKKSIADKIIDGDITI